MKPPDATIRSKIMASVKGKDTAPELRVRSAAHRLGYRFRLHRKDLPGKPDVVFPALRIALFVHGCFWHGHTCQHGSRRPAANAEYWRNKIEGNMNRDRRVQAELVNMGWKPVVLWECQIVTSNLPDLLRGILVSG